MGNRFGWPTERTVRGCDCNRVSDTRVPTNRPLGYRLLQALGRGLLRIVADLEIDGTANYPESGPYLIVFNHLHWLDLPVAFVTLRHQMAGLAGHEWAAHPLVGPMARHIGHAIFVQKATDHRALSDALAWLRGGGVLLLAPEGARSLAGSLLPGQPGAAYLASRGGVPIVPLAAWGHEHLFDDLRRLRRARIRVRIGQPFVLAGTPNRAKGEQLDAYTEQIMLALAALLPREYRGVYADRAD